MHRLAFVDQQELAKDFATGDIVRKISYRGYIVSPYAGRVVYSNPKTGTVQVRWPWGEEQESPAELIREPTSERLPAQGMEQYSTWEGSRLINDEETLKVDKKWRNSLASRVVNKFERRTLPIWREACKAWHNSLNEIEAFKLLSSKYAGVFGTEPVRLTVSNLYALGNQYKVSIYYKDNQRHYKVTKSEKNSGKLKCPRCGGTRMKPRTYRQGKKLIQCRDCGFSISPKDLVYD